MEEDILKDSKAEDVQDIDMLTEDALYEENEAEQPTKKSFLSDSLPTVLLGKIGDILLLHFAFLICSLPIVTVGAALSATCYVGMKMASGVDGHVLGNFLKAFKVNFKRSTLYWIVCVITSSVIWFSYQYWSAIGGVPGMVLSCVSVVLAILLAMTMLYLFAVQAKFENTFGATIKNALLMSVRHLHITVLMVLCFAFFGYLAVNFSVMQALGAVTGAGVLGMVFGKLYNVVFSSYE